VLNSVTERSGGVRVFNGKFFYLTHGGRLTRVRRQEVHMNKGIVAGSLLTRGGGKAYDMERSRSKEKGKGSKK